MRGGGRCGCLGGRWRMRRWRRRWPGGRLFVVDGQSGTVARLPAQPTGVWFLPVTDRIPTPAGAMPGAGDESGALVVAGAGLSTLDGGLGGVLGGVVGGRQDYLPSLAQLETLTALGSMPRQTGPTGDCFYQGLIDVAREDLAE